MLAEPKFSLAAGPTHVGQRGFEWPFDGPLVAVVLNPWGWRTKQRGQIKGWSMRSC